MGQKKNAKGTVSIFNADNRIRLRWRYQKERFSINLLQYSKNNLLVAKKVALEIETDIASGNFDVTLLKYKNLSHQIHPKGTEFPNAKFTSQPQVLEGMNLAAYFKLWTEEYKNIDLNKNLHYSGIYNMLKRWKEISLDKILERFNSEKLAIYTYNERLRMLNQFLNWTCKHKYCLYNPLEDVKSKRSGVKKVKASRVPFSEDEIVHILNAFREDTYSKHKRYKHSHYYPFMFFLFSTGVRNAEAIGLRVSHLDFVKDLITISEVLARGLSNSHAASRTRKETKNGKVRQLPMSAELKVLLLKQAQGKESDDLVFTSPKGMAIDDRMFQNRVFKPILRQLKIAERDLYACRHTFASRCINAGFTPVMTAFLMGNNPETALRNYVHMMELPKSLPDITLC